jgi:hypothetical protein
MRGGSGNDQFGGGGWPNGRWVYLPDKPGAAYLITEPFSEIQPTPEHWLNKDFFKIEKPRSIAVSFPDATTNSWKLARETESGEWKLTDAKPEEQLDSSQVSGVTSPFASPSFEDVESQANVGGSDLGKPTIIEVETFDGFSYAVKAGVKKNENYHLALSISATLPKERTPGKDEKPEDKEKLDKEFKDRQKKLEEKLTQEKAFEKWTYVVSGWTVDSLLKERSQLLLKKQTEPEKASPGETNANDKPVENKAAD